MKEEHIYDVLTGTSNVKEIINTNITNDFVENSNLNELRMKRDIECFPIINRGQLWYASLTEEQLIELNAWYQAWLNATETLVIPDKPIWLE